MYCPVCGAESTQGLNFCKRCGANISPTGATPRIEARPPRTVTIVYMAIAVVMVCLGGLGIALGVAGGLAASGVKGPDGPIPIALAGSAVVLFVSLRLLHLLARLISASISEGSPERRAPKLGDFQRPALPEQPRSVGSVTENTTRNFEPPLYGERHDR